MRWPSLPFIWETEWSFGCPVRMPVHGRVSPHRSVGCTICFSVLTFNVQGFIRNFVRNVKYEFPLAFTCIFFFVHQFTGLKSSLESCLGSLRHLVVKAQWRHQVWQPRLRLMACGIGSPVKFRKERAGRRRYPANQQPPAHTCSQPQLGGRQTHWSAKLSCCDRSENALLCSLL